MNTSTATGQTLTQGFIDWRAYSNRNPDMNIATLPGKVSGAGMPGTKAVPGR
jgi:hypothetical protein